MDRWTDGQSKSAYLENKVISGMNTIITSMKFFLVKRNIMSMASIAIKPNEQKIEIFY